MNEEEILGKVDISAHKERLMGLFKKYGPQMLKAAYGQAASQIPADVAWSGTDPRLKAFAKELATRVTGISETTRDSLKSVIGGALAGEKDSEGRVVQPSVTEIRKRILEQGDITSKSRAHTIARTEVATAQRKGSLMAYEDGDIDEVEAIDGDKDDECAARDGKRFTLDEANDVDPHPNCVLSWKPIVKRKN